MGKVIIWKNKTDSYDDSAEIVKEYKGEGLTRKKAFKVFLEEETDFPKNWLTDWVLKKHRLIALHRVKEDYYYYGCEYKED